MPAIVRNMDRDIATIIMVDSNLQRENILPSERAKAYKMKMDAIKRQGARTDLTSPNISAKFRSDDEIGQEAGVSGRVIVQFVVDTDGSIGSVQTLRTPDKRLSDQVEALVKKAPKWTPGKQRGKAVRVHFTIPVTFRLSN